MKTIALTALLALASATALASAPIPPPPTLQARSWILVDQHSGQTLASHAADQSVEPASLTKLMTAYVAFHALQDGRLSLQQPVSISHAARYTDPDGSRSYLEIGSRVPVEVLLQGMIVQSGNDASIALAEAIAGNEATFATLMNQYASRLGMSGSHFDNSSGLPRPSQQVTAADMSRLARAIISEFPNYYRWYSQRNFTWNGITQGNRNGLLERDPSVDGMKTGYTKSAGYCLVSSAEREGTRLVAVVMGTDSAREREAASLTLLNYGFSFYETRQLRGAGLELAEQRVYKAAGGRIAVGLADDLYVTAPRGSLDKIEIQIELAPKVVAPLTMADRVGTVRALLDGKVVAEAPLQPLADAPMGGFFRRLWDTILSWFA